MQNSSQSQLTVQATYFQKKGERTADSCADVVYTRSTADFLFYGLADGQSGKSHGAEGGRASLEAIADYLQECTIGGLTENRFLDELPCALAQRVRRCLLSLSSEQNNPFDAYASTVVAIAIDPVSTKYVLIHLGDGCVIKMGQGGNPEMMSCPDNGITRRHTWLTTSKNAVAHFRVAFGSVWEMNRIVLLSDGAQCLCAGSNIMWRAKELLANGTREDIFRYLSRHPSGDDSSCLVLDFLPCSAPGTLQKTGTVADT